MTWSDEQISAYLDGELPEDDRRQIETAMETDDVLRARIEAFQNVDDALLSVLGHFDEEPIPDGILALVRAHSVTANDNLGGSVVPLQSIRKPRSRLIQFAAIAATLVVGVFVGIQINDSDRPNDLSRLTAGLVSSESLLFATLETVPSGEVQGNLQPILSFKTGEGDICREVLAPEQRALACRSDGDWTVLAISRDASSASGEDYETASAASSIAFDVLTEQLMVGVPLSATEEQDLLSLPRG